MSELSDTESTHTLSGDTESAVSLEAMREPSIPLEAKSTADIGTIIGDVESTIKFSTLASKQQKNGEEIFTVNNYVDRQSNGRSNRILNISPVIF